MSENVMCKGPEMENQTHTTGLLHSWRRGSQGAGDRLLRHVYSDLLRVARRAMRGEREGHTLQPTALVNEAYLRLVKAEISWRDRAHFFAVAARSMRRILTDHARALARTKRGGEATCLSWQNNDAVTEEPGLDLLGLEAAMKVLQKRAPKAYRAIELCYFGGLSYPEIAEVMGASRATIARELQFGKAWLRARLSSGADLRHSQGHGACV